MNKIVSLFLALAMILSLTAGIASAEEKKTDLVLACSMDMTSFDPAATSNIANLNVVNMVYNRLYELDDYLGGYPVLAEKTWYDENDECVLYIKIYEGVMFSDGTEMTSEDVVASIEYARTAATAKSLTKFISSVEAVDKYTVKFTTDGVYPTITTAFTHQACSILPKHYIEEATASGDWSNPIGSGRYLLKERVVGDHVVLVKNENYFNPEGAAQNDSLTYKIVPEGSSRIIMVETGEADIDVNFNTAEYDRVKNESNVAVHEWPSATMYFLGMDVQNEKFSNKLVRQAINYAVDPAVVLYAAYNNLGTVNRNICAPACVGWYSDNPGGYTFDLEKAQALMAEAGYPNGFETELYCWNDTLQRVAEVVQGYLMMIGINAKICRIEDTARQELAATGGMPMWVQTWGCYQDPDLFWARILCKEGHGGSNFSHYDNPEFEAAYMKGHSTTVTADREAAYKVCQDIAMEDCPWCPLFVSTMIAFTTADLQGVEINTESPYNYYKLHY